MQHKVFLGITPPEYSKMKKDADSTTSFSIIDIPSGEPIPGELLLSRAHFRFGSTMQNFKRTTIFTNCLNFQPLSSPTVYIDGLIKLVPTKAKDEARGILSYIGLTLTKWLKGKIFSMMVVFVLTAIGLLILDVPLWLVLSLLAGLLSFVPNFGPLIALVPAVLIGFMEGRTTALLVLGLYILVQVLESNLITPKIQKKLINIPPALIITAQLFMGVLTGGWGLILATPVVAILFVVVEKLWIEKQEPPKTKLRI